MRAGVWAGVVAGAAGTAALNIATYADMAIRGRPASEVPAKLAGTMVEQAGVDLSGEGPGAEETASNRRTGLGALMGYVTGLGVGTGYALLRPSLRAIPLPVAGLGVGFAAMAASDVPASLAGATNPATWTIKDWALDAGFHLVYGFTTVVAYDAIAGA
jgi:hypothetical protein